MLEIIALVTLVALAFNVAIISQSISRLFKSIQLIKDILDNIFSRLETLESKLNVSKTASDQPAFNKHKFFDELPSHQMTSKEASRAIEAAIVRNYNTLPIEVTVVDMFNLGVKLGRIKETEDGKIQIIRSGTEG